MDHSLPLPARSGATARSRAAQARLAARLLLFVLMLVAAWLALLPFVAVPQALPAEAPAGQFSAERALAHVAFIAAEPHPLGSQRQLEVRDYLLGEIRALGLEPQIQRETVAGNAFLTGLPAVVQVENLMVRVPGQNNQGALLLSGHYDSVPTSGGAADCAACTATVLETLRAVLAGPPLQNDVIFLFTDGEEVGISGAEAFATRHPWMDDVALTLVHEGLGTQGAALLYATSPGSGPLLEEALAAVESPRAYSLINGLMWNVQGNSGSDLDAFIAEHGEGMAFVNLSLEGATSYHTQLDNPQTLSAGTLQHHGDYALDLVRHFGNRAWQAAGPETDLVVFPLLPGLNVRYPEALALPLAVGAALLTLLLLLWAGSRQRIGLGPFLAGTLLYFLGLFAALIAGVALWWAVRWLNPALHSFFVGGFYDSSLYLLALVAVALAVTAFFVRPLTLRQADDRISARRSASLQAAVLLWWVLLGLLLSLSLPGMSYAFTLPLLLVLPVLAWQWAQPAGGERPLLEALLLLLPAVVALLLVAPVLYILAILGLRLEAIMGLPFFVLPLPFAVLLYGLLLPQTAFLLGQRQRLLAPGLVLLALALLLVAGLRAGFDEAHPGTNMVAYVLDADAGAAQWVTVNDSLAGRGTRAQVDEWTAQFFPDGGQETTFGPWLSGGMNHSQPALAADAPFLNLQASHLTLLDEVLQSDGRRLRLAITPPPEALDSVLSVVPAEGTLLVAAALNGTALELPDPALLQVDVYGRPGPFTLDLATTGQGRLTITFHDRYLGLPQLAEFPIAPRPAWLMPAPFSRTADSSIVVSRHTK